ncbi:MAG: glycoside hydrolase [Clostridiales bacterium]|nr:glycoside hydrolase [Clostridiales bacterium]
MTHKKVTMLQNEVWYGPSSKHGELMPHNRKTVYSVNIETNATCNQDNPLLISNMGRFIYAPRGFSLDISGGVISAVSKFGEIDFAEGFGTLRGAYLEACRRYFPPSGSSVIPPQEFFTCPQYNTWIELIYDQNEDDILKYARGIVENGLPAGILMIDDGWNDYYGSYRFSKSKFPHPREMCRTLHEMGFKVMMWISPFISPDMPEYRELAAGGMLVRRKNAQGAMPAFSKNGISVAVREWWNGWSAVLDMTNPDTVRWLDNRLSELCDLGVDGFKLDAGDACYYFEDDITYSPVTPAEHAELWNRYGLKYDYNEFRACYKCAGLPLVQRLHDKPHSWEGGVSALVPDTLAQGLLGYAYVCPDMIGGGSFADFLPNSKTFDAELLIRYCEASALMPMMQFSLAPWRVLDEEHYKVILKYAELHEEFAPRILELAHESSRTGEPIVRSLEYVFPHEGFEKITDCFMLGDDILVAPVYKKGETVRIIPLPNGIWEDECGVRYEGGQTITVDAPLDRLPRLKKVKR